MAKHSTKIRIGISSCLVGAEVRFDGGHKKDSYIVGTLSRFFEFVPVCPEVAIGLGTPRQPIRLTDSPAGVRVRGVRDPSLDVTDALADYGRTMAASMSDICGYILKRGSPSCGMERVKVYSEKGMPLRTRAGIYAQTFMEAQPRLPVEEEGRLGDPGLRENFIQRVLILARWRSEMARQCSAKSILSFHTRHKLQIMAHNQAAYRRLGRLLADAGKYDPAKLADIYIDELMQTLQRKSTRRSNTNVLQHLMGYLKKSLTAQDKVELGDLIDAYRIGNIPLIVPITMLNHYFRRHPNPYVEQQYYLNPHPAELMLRNQI